ncbi:transposase [Streptomyces anulatus]|uniref:transposase n=1 Tax=Streptomyces anulatus TaxID=1892 RepID=UPI0036497C83
MGSRGDLTDAHGERLEPLLPVSNRRCGRWRDHRHVINGVLYRIRTGVQWRDLPDRYGPWKTAHERHRRRTAPGNSHCSGSKPRRTRSVTSTGTSPSTPRQCVRTTVLPGPATLRHLSKGSPHKRSGPLGSGPI